MPVLDGPGLHRTDALEEDAGRYGFAAGPARGAACGVPGRVAA